MGKYMRKCKVLGEIAVMEVSPSRVRTRARTLAIETAERRKRARILTPSPENSVSPANYARVPYDRCPSPDRVPASRCSSNGSSELVNQPSRSADPEGFENATDSNCRERRETTPSSNLRSESDELESTARPPAGNPRRKPTAEKMPSVAEIEDFFAAAEKDEKKRFAEKYNFDVEKEVPLEGRYEWVRLK
ncbi:cyclin-dependent kinase inhibitor 5-like [Magnolia sinica]|uniref:cyclin-dependent kinase inhibitor 5-like n=1 Tax=Magnolia sinica TaxID=86752 RepID=UPI00265A0907|nr:cyclin-dependent kinase inhibitor 5-like [Magnolia sinica]